MHLGFVALGVVVGCEQGGVFVCAQSVECATPGVVGRCVAGYCGFLDAACPSGLRYGEHAPPELAGACTEPDDPVAGDDDAGSSEASGHGTKGPLATDDGGDTGTDDDGTTDDGTVDGGGFVVPTETCELDFVDEFDTGVLDRRWGFDTEVSFEIQPGPEALALKIFADQIGSAHIEAPLGPFIDRAIEVVSLVEDDTAHAYAWLEVRTELAHRIEIDGGHMRFVDGDDDPTVAIEIDAQAHRWLRIDVSATDVRYQASPDGTAWIDLHVAASQLGAGDATVAIGLTATLASASEPRLTLDRIAACTWSQ